MNHPGSIARLFVFVICGAIISIQANGEPAMKADGYSILLSQRLSEIASLSGDFQQQNIYDSNTIYKGRLWIARPYQFRVDTILPSMQSLVSDGQNFWSYDEDLEQVIISKLNKDLSEVPILLFSSDIGSIEAAYAISGYSDEGQEYFLLEPKSDTSLFKSLLLEFHGATPSSIRINTATGEQIIINLANVVLNEEIRKEQFIFVVPDNADVIDER